MSSEQRAVSRQPSGNQVLSFTNCPDWPTATSASFRLRRKNLSPQILRQDRRQRHLYRDRDGGVQDASAAQRTANPDSYPSPDANPNTYPGPDADTDSHASRETEPESDINPDADTGSEPIALTDTLKAI